MIRFSLPDSPPARVGESCLHHKFRRASCRACVDVCPVGALTVTPQGISLADEQCLHCGNCLYVCPGKALVNLKPPVRYFREQCLVEPFTLLPPTLNELLLWHTKQHIRGVALELDDFPQWGLSIAALNLKLREFGEHGWQIYPPQSNGLNISRRNLLHVRDASACSAAMDPDDSWNIFPEFSTHTPQLDTADCVLCAACVRVCPQKALLLEGESLSVITNACNGCNACKAVCPADAITIRPEMRKAEEIVYPLHNTQCKTCSRRFLSWDEHTAQCPVCRQHGYGMR